MALIEVGPYSLYQGEQFIDAEFTGAGPVFFFDCTFWGKTWFTDEFCQAGAVHTLSGNPTNYLTMINCYMPGGQNLN